MRLWMFSCLLLFAVIFGAPTVTTAAPPPAQSYSTWLKDNSGRYYCIYYYKIPNSSQYSHQYCYYFTAQPEWIYWFKPGTNVYWARTPTQSHPNWQFGEEQWSFRRPDGNYTDITNDCPVVTPDGPKEPGNGIPDGPLVPNPPPIPVPCL